MGRKDRKAEHAVMDEDTLQFLLGEEIRSFGNDNFAGSNEEHQIFMEVFYGKNACRTARRDQDRQPGDTLSTYTMDMSDMSRSTPHRIVESFSQGIISSCYFSSRHDERHGLDNVGNSTPDKSNCCNNLIKEGKLDDEENAIPALGSRESSASRLKKCNFSSDSDVATHSAAFARELPNRLRLHAHNLLLDAGWKIETRRRKDGNKIDSIFKTPGEGIVINSLIKAWKMCGELLIAGVTNSAQKKGYRQWSEIDVFWHELADAMAYIENEVQHAENSLSLLHRWNLLDPYVSVVCIDKKIGALRDGKAVKFMKGRSVELHMNKRLYSGEESRRSLGGQPAKFTSYLVNYNSREQHGSGRFLRKVSCGSEAKKKKLRSLARSTRNGSNMKKRLHNMKHTIYFDCSDKTSTSLHVPSSTLCSTSYESNPLSLNSHMSMQELLRQEMKLVRASSARELINSKDTEGIDFSDSCRNFPMENQLCGEAANRQHASSLHVGLDGKVSDNSFLLCSEVSDMLKAGGGSWGSVMSVNCEVPNLTGTRTLWSPETSSSVTKTCSKKEKHKKDVTVRTSSVRLNMKKLVKPQLDKAEACSLVIDTVQEAKEGNGCKCQGKNAYSSLPTLRKLLQHNEIKTLPNTGNKLKMPGLWAAHNERLVKLQSDIGGMEAAHVSEQKSPESQTIQETAEKTSSETQKENCRKRRHRDNFHDDDLLISVVIKAKNPSITGIHSFCHARKFHLKGFRKLKNRKGSYKLLPRTPGKGATQFVSSAKTPLAWLLNCGFVSLNASVQYRRPGNNTVLKDGLVTREGILCKCCSNTFSISAFKYHAGHKVNQSSLNLFLESGESYTLCQLQAWSGEYKARRDSRQVAEVEAMDQNDDTCGLCGDGGELICCDNCPSTFHQACLQAQIIPEGSWYCPNCTCQICGDAAISKMPLKSFIMLECSQCEKKCHDVCLKEDSSSGIIVPHAWFCGEYCEKVYFGLRSRVGVMSALADGFSWTILRCHYNDPKVQSAQKIAQLAECNIKLAVALSIIEECFLPMIDPRTGVNLIPQLLYNWGSNFPRLNYHGFYTVALEKNDYIISVATIRVHGVAVAEIPLIATCTEHRRQGMCRRLLGAIEEMLKSFKVETLVLSAIPDLISTWTSGFGFKPVSDDEKKELNTTNLILFPGTTLLKKSLCEDLEMRKPADKVSSYSREGFDHTLNFCSRSDSSLTAGGDMTSVTMQRGSIKSESFEGDSQQQNIPASSNIIAILADDKLHDASDLAPCGGDISTSGTDLSTDPRSSVVDEEFRDMERSCSGNVGGSMEHSVMDGLQNKKSAVRSPARNKICEDNLLKKIDFPDNGTVPMAPDEVSASVAIQREVSSSSIATLVSVKSPNSAGFRAELVGIKEDCNSSTRFCVKEVDNRSKPDLEPAEAVLDPVMVPLLNQHSEVPCTLPHRNFQVKNVHNICPSLMNESRGNQRPSFMFSTETHKIAKDSDVVKIRMGFLPQRDDIVNAAIRKLSLRAASNCGEIAMEEVEKSLRDLSLCLQEESVQAKK